MSDFDARREKKKEYMKKWVAANPGNLEAIDKLIDAAAEFMAVCAEHGYLIYKEEE